MLRLGAHRPDLARAIEGPSPSLAFSLLLPLPCSSSPSPNLSASRTGRATRLSACMNVGALPAKLELLRRAMEVHVCNEGDPHATCLEGEDVPLGGAESGGAAVPGITEARSERAGGPSLGLPGPIVDDPWGSNPPGSTVGSTGVTALAGTAPSLGAGFDNALPSNQNQQTVRSGALPSSAEIEPGVHFVVELHMPEDELCTHSVIELTTALETMMKYGAESYDVSLTPRQPTPCTYPAEPCLYCKRGAAPPFLTPDEVVKGHQILIEAKNGRMPTLATLLTLFPRIVVQESVDDDWVCICKWGPHSLVTRSPRAYLASSKMVVEILEFLEGCLGFYDSVDRVKPIVDVNVFVTQRYTPGQAKALFLQAIQLLCPAHPIVCEVTQGGPPHLPFFVVQMHWLGLEVLTTGTVGESKRTVEERAFVELMQLSKRFRTTGGACRFYARGKRNLRLWGGAIGDDCPCCLEVIEAGQDVEETPCGHHYHRACYDAYVETGARVVIGDVEQLRCALCRAHLANHDRPRRPPPPPPDLLPGELAALMAPPREEHPEIVGYDQTRFPVALMGPQLYWARAFFRNQARGGGVVDMVDLFQMDGGVPVGPVYGHHVPQVDARQAAPCGLAAIVGILAAAIDFEELTPVLIDRDLIINGLHGREARQRLRVALHDRIALANDLWAEHGIDRFNTFADLRRIVIALNLDIRLVAGRFRPINNPMAAENVQVEAVTYLEHIARPVDYAGPRFMIYFQPPRLGRQDGHYVGLDLNNTVRRHRPAPIAPAQLVWEPRAIHLDDPEVLMLQYNEGLDFEVALARDVIDHRNPRYAGERPGVIVLGEEEFEIPAPGIPIAALGGEFAAVPPPAGAALPAGMPLPAPAEPPPLPPLPPFRPLDPIPAAVIHAAPEILPAPLPAAVFADALVPRERPAPEVGCFRALWPFGREDDLLPHEFNLQDAVLISTASVPALSACHWVRVPTMADTRRRYRFDYANESCTCHFSPFQIIPCKHIWQASFIILGPGYQKVLSSASMVGYYMLMCKPHYFASFHGGRLQLVTSKGEHGERAYWVDPSGTDLTQPNLLNPAGPITALHFSGYPVALERPVSCRGADGTTVLLVRPESRLSYASNRLARLIAGFAEDFNIIQALKGGGIGILYRLLLQAGDPGLAVLSSVVSIWNDAVKSAGLHALCLATPKMTAIGHIFGWLTTTLSTLGVPVVGQVMMMAFVGLAIKVITYHVFRDRLGISGPWADVAFIATVGLEAAPVAVVRWFLTKGTDPELSFGHEVFAEDPMAGPEEELVAARDAVYGYALARSLQEPAIFRAAATGLIAYNRASHMLRPSAFDTLVAQEADRCHVRRRLVGGRLIVDRGVPERGHCFNYPFCMDPLKKKKHQRNFNLCHRCLATHPNRPGQEPSFERGQAALEGVRITGRVPLLAIRSRYYDSPDGTIVFVPPGCKVTTNVRPNEFRHPDFCKTKKVGLGIGYVHPGWMPSHQHAGISAVLMGLFERTFQYGQPYNLRAIRTLIRMIDLFAERSPDFTVDKMADDDWLVTQLREAELRPAMASLRQDDGFGVEDGEIGLFCKSEWLNATKAGRGPYGLSKPRRGYKKRGIYTPKDKAHCAVGPWAKPMQAHVAKVMSKHTGYMYAGKATPAELNEFADRVTSVFDQVHVLMADIARCETNKHPGVVNARMRYYHRKWTRMDTLRDRVIYLWKRGRFRCKQGIGRASGQLPPNMTLSGEDFTSVDNSFDIGIATMLLVYCVLEEIEPEDMTDEQIYAVFELWENGTVFGAGNGDDTTVIIPRQYRGRHIDQEQFLEAYQRVAIKLGFLVTGKWSRGPWDVVFLGMRTYYCSDGKYRFGRLIGRSSVKNHFARDLQGDPYAWLLEVASAEAMTQPHVPLLYHKAARVVEVLRKRIGGRQPLRFRDRKLLEHSARWLMCDGAGVTYTERTWAELGECYGLSVELLKREVERINEAEWFPYALSGEVWEQIFTVDTEY